MRMIPTFARRIAPGPRRPRRHGFTIVEMIVVLVMMGILMSIALPRFGTLRDKSAVSSAKQKIVGYVATARAAAIRQSSSAQFRLWSGNMHATVTQPDGTSLMLGGSEQLDKTEGVTVTRGTGVVKDVITYDARGLASLGGTYIYVVTRNSAKDSLCISRLGLIARTCGS
jgi:prepilin-type N-terminal cleavage/methylation domain-containing protein